jgi:colanic acid biosynthesis glycosyl transferase WcaI
MEGSATHAQKPLWFKKEVKYVNGNRESAAIQVYRCPQYIPSRPTGKARMMLDLTFFVSVFFLLICLLFRKKYDLVIVVAPCFSIGAAGILYKKIKGAKFLYHIQDLQIDVARDLRMIKSARIISLLLKAEKYILKNADIISSISQE